MHFDYTYATNWHSFFLAATGPVLQLDIPATLPRRRLNWGVRWGVITNITGHFKSDLIFRRSGEIICRLPYNISFTGGYDGYALDQASRQTGSSPVPSFGADWMVLKDGEVTPSMEIGFCPQYLRIAADQVSWEVYHNSVLNGDGWFWALLAVNSTADETVIISPV